MMAEHRIKAANQFGRLMTNLLGTFALYYVYVGLRFGKTKKHPRISANFVEIIDCFLLLPASKFGVYSPL